VQQGKLQKQIPGISRTQVSTAQKANAQLNNQWDSGPQTVKQTTKRQLTNTVAQGTLGYKIIKQNNHKGTTVCQSPAIGKRSHTQYTTQNINQTI